MRYLHAAIICLALVPEHVRSIFTTYLTSENTTETDSSSSSSSGSASEEQGPEAMAKMTRAANWLEWNLLGANCLGFLTLGYKVLQSLLDYWDEL